jgi:CheY-like chemotaxis protein
MGIRHARGGRVVVSARPAGWGVNISVSALDSPSGELSPDDQVSLDVIRHLLRTCRGRLDPSTARSCFSVGIVLPASEQVPVLAIDDNKDTLALIQRFLTGTCYRFWGSTTLDEALAIARQTRPEIILIDVMMPAIDGWETMGRLRQHPLTCSVPIIVCTILAEEELALSLGARAYIRKPFSRETLLQVLDRQRVS